MEKIKNKTSNWFEGTGLGLYIGFVLPVLRMILTDGFSISFSIAFGIACLFTVLTAYPLFIRGTENRWTKDNRKWNFLTWLVISVITSILAFTILGLLFNYKNFFINARLRLR